MTFGLLFSTMIVIPVICLYYIIPYLNLNLRGTQFRLACVVAGNMSSFRSVKYAQYKNEMKLFMITKVWYELGTRKCIV